MSEAVKTEGVKEAAHRLAMPMLAKGFRPAGLHTYTDAAGKPLYYRIRAKHPATGEKWIRPMRRNGVGWELSEPQFTEGKPLYCLHRLAEKPGAPAWFCEGENCTDALVRLGVLATTSGGASSDEAAHLGPLAGRTVTIWPDNDGPGLEHAQRVAAKLRALRCTVEMIDARALGLSEKGDCVDWLAAHPGATAADLAKLPRLVAAPEKIARVDEGLSGLVLRRVSEVEARPVRWLWPGRIARGKVSDISGDPGLGKSQITASIAGVLTTGGRWPVDRTSCERGSVVFLSAEDGVADTIRPRLEASGADLDRCHVIEAVRDGFTADGRELRRMFDLRRDLSRLEVLLARLPDAALVVIDPVSAYLGETNSHNNAEVRGLLAPVSDIAERFGIAVLTINHLNKGTGPAIRRVNGSIGFVGAARAAFVVAADPEDHNRRFFLPSKNNLAKDQGGLGYRLEGYTLPGGIETSRVSWEGAPVSMTADQALASSQDTEERTARDDAELFLRDLLSDGPVPSKLVRSNAEGAGHSWRTVERASKAVGVEAYREGGLGKDGIWYWRLTPNTAKDPYLRQPKTVAVLGGVGGFSAEACPDPTVSRASLQPDLAKSEPPPGSSQDSPQIDPEAEREAAEERAAIIAEGCGVDSQAEEF